jgi:hypothetical protein
MKSKRKHFLALSLAGIGAIGAFASVSAASIQAGTPTATRDQVKTAIKQAFTVGDYQAYLATTKDYKVGVPVLTEAQFNAMVQANKLRASGDVAGAKKILDQAGIKPQIKASGAKKTTSTHVKNPSSTTKQTVSKTNKTQKVPSIKKTQSLKKITPVTNPVVTQ